MPRDPEQFAHLEWLGYVQPVGLVVSIPALLNAQAHVQRNISVEHQQFLACLPRDKHDEVISELRDFPAFAQTVLGWEPGDLLGHGGSSLPPELEVAIPGYNETLSASYAVPELQPRDASRPWMMLIKELPLGQQLDALSSDGSSYWQATSHAKFERLLRETQVPLGLLVNGTHLRIVYAPRGETSGYATFSVADMAKVAGRPIFAALHMLLNSERLFSLPERQRLPAILADSRKYQNVVSTKLAEQVLGALYELLRGFQSADEQRRGELLREVLKEDPNHVYAGLLTVLLRLVFVLYAEDRGLLSNDPVYSNYYSLTGLFERLRADAGRYPDTMDQRYGAWAQLLTLFRLIYDGGRHNGLHIPPRRGYLFDPDRYNFLEGRPWTMRRQDTEVVDLPCISDGVIHRVLEKLLILDGERLSYRTLDVEQIGSVYETIMGFNLEVAQGRSIAIKPVKSHGAPATINLDALLATRPADRGNWLKDQTDQKLTGQAAIALKEADSIEALLVALERKIDKQVTPNIVPPAAMVFQPSDERRRSGSHYTPRSLTEPIVRTTLRPILEQLGESPTSEQILALKVCDPAMGSGAFLVEACRQLGDALVEAWHVHNCLPALPPDEDEVLHARRLIAQRCLYGVDKNPMAVDLSKLSLWLATLAKDHPFTFLDHSLRCGDSLVGLSREQIAAFHWQPATQREFLGEKLRERISRATDYRAKILAARDDVPYEQLRQCLDVADEALSLIRLVGDATVAAFFQGSRPREREQRRLQLAQQVDHYLSSASRIEDREPIAQAVRELRSGPVGISAFHWEIEFPEVFSRENGGFDAIVGNPPFMGGSKISTAMGRSYTGWLSTFFPESKGKSDLVAYFFRRVYEHLRNRGTLGLISTNTICQGDTRHTGLRWIRRYGGCIYEADKRRRWPGLAAVVVSVVHICKRHRPYTSLLLNHRPVEEITAYLFHFGPDENPETLLTNKPLVHSGTNINGTGFVLSADQRAAFLNADKSCDTRILPYLGAEEMNSTPLASHTRYVIYLDDLDEAEAKRWSLLYRHLSETVREQRQASSERRLREEWWRYSRPARALYDAIKGHSRVLSSGRAGGHICFAFQPIWTIFSDSLTLFVFDQFPGFAMLQSRVHEVWARLMGSSLKDDSRYIPEDCFETFPFPESFESSVSLDATGSAYYKCRSELMIKTDEGLTATYNRFHDPHETSPDILKLRELHAAMDRAVLDAYDWNGIPTDCGFALDYLDIEDEDELPPEARERIESGELFFPDAPSAAAFDASVRTGRRSLPWRYRWPDDVRDEVLARLLALNAERAEEERLAGLAAEETKAGRKKPTAAGKPVPKKPRKSAKVAAAAGDLFAPVIEHLHRTGLLLLRAWEGRALTRRAFNAGMILMLDDKLRVALLDNNAQAPRHRVSEGELNQILTELSIDGFVEIETAGRQQIVKVSPTAPSTDDASEDELKRISEVKEYFRREAETGNVIESEESVDAELDLVPAA